MAYAAVASLEQTLQQILRYADGSQFHVQHYPILEFQSIHDKLFSLRSTLDKLFPVPKNLRKRKSDFEIQISDAMYDAQEKIESYISSLSTLDSESDHNQQIPTPLNKFLENFHKTIAEVTLEAEFMLEAKEIAVSIEQRNAVKQQQDQNLFSGTAPSLRIIGQEEDKALVMKHMSTTRILQVIRIMGMPGIGKTTLARSVYDDPYVVNQFDVRAWVTVPAECEIRDIYSVLLCSMEKWNEKNYVSGSASKSGDEVSGKSEMQLVQSLHQKLFGRRYLIVIDDMADTGVWGAILRPCPRDQMNSSRIIMTTRNRNVAKHVKLPGLCHEIQPLSPEDSWRLMCYRVFREDQSNCPPHLEGIGRQIANNCQGLPLSLTVVGDLLFKEKKAEAFWQNVAEDTIAAANTSNESFKEVLSLSYNQLPGRLKACFLYMGAFPEDSEILASKLMQLWVAEGLIPPSASPDHASLEQVAEEYLEDLVGRNLISVGRRSSDGRIRTCRMHYTLWDLAVKECLEEKFFHSLYCYNQNNSESEDSQRRLSVHKNVLMGFKDVYESIKSIKSVRTVLYLDTFHPHPLPYFLTFEFLRVLDALALCFITFPNEIVKLIHLRYLSLAYDGKLPSSISKLRNLQVLIVRHKHLDIIFPSSILPVEIWKMPQLRHILFTGVVFPGISGVENLARYSALLENLQTLSFIHASCLTKEVLENIPNVKKLGVWIEAPTAVELHLDVLHKLEAFKFNILNPIFEPESASVPNFYFPRTLLKLTLSGCGIQWDDMTVVGQLPRLQVLKLRDFACQGPEWCPNEGEFLQLKHLLLESLELEKWDAEYFHFPRLERLIIKYCYELEEIPEDIGSIGTLQLIEVIECSPGAVRSAEMIQKTMKELDIDIQIRIQS